MLDFDNVSIEHPNDNRVNFYSDDYYSKSYMVGDYIRKKSIGIRVFLPTGTPTFEEKIMITGEFRVIKRIHSDEGLRTVCELTEIDEIEWVDKEEGRTQLEFSVDQEAGIIFAQKGYEGLCAYLQYMRKNAGQ